jgi:hypothetical protein
MVTVSRAPNIGRPSVFDFQGRAKWDEWDKQGKSLSELSLPEVEAKYIERCVSLGWVASTTSTSTKDDVPIKSALASPMEEENVHDIDWDAPVDPAKAGSGGRATGVKVSVLQEHGEDNRRAPTTAHDLAVLGDAGKLRTLLELDSSLDINQKDEFVSLMQLIELLALTCLIGIHSFTSCCR